MEYVQQERLKKVDSNYNNYFVGNLVPELEYYKGVEFINKTNTNKQETLKRTDLIKDEKTEADKVFYNF